MIEVLAETPSEESVLDEIISLDFGTGHANSTFEVLRSCQDTGQNASQIFNQGTARYIYNSDSDTVYYINRNKNICGVFLIGPKKDHIINVMAKSKTMQKKI